MKDIYYWILPLELFAYWYTVAAGFETIFGVLAFLIAAVLCVLSIRKGCRSYVSDGEGEGLALAVVGILIFVGLTARWLVSFRWDLPLP